MDRANGVIGDINDQIKTYIDNRMSQYIDYFDLNQFLEDKKQEGSNYFADHIHLNEAGYEAWANELDIRYF